RGAGSLQAHRVPDSDRRQARGEVPSVGEAGAPVPLARGPPRLPLHVRRALHDDAEPVRFSHPRAARNLEAGGDEGGVVLAGTLTVQEDVRRAVDPLEPKPEPAPRPLLRQVELALIDPLAV